MRDGDPSHPGFLAAYLSLHTRWTFECADWQLCWPESGFFDPLSSLTLHHDSRPIHTGDRFEQTVPTAIEMYGNVQFP